MANFLLCTVLLAAGAGEPLGRMALESAPLARFAFGGAGPSPRLACVQARASVWMASLTCSTTMPGVVSSSPTVTCVFVP